MRKLMWFAVGFAGAGLLCGYWLSRQWYLPAVILCCLMLAGCLLGMLKWRAARLPAVVLLGAVCCFVWNFAADSLYYSAVRQFDAQRGGFSAVALEDAEPTNYGFRVKCLTHLEGKPYCVMVYVDDSHFVALGDTVTGEFTLYSCLPDGSRDSSYNRGNGVFLMASSGKSVAVTAADRLAWYCWPTQVRYQITERLDAIFPEDTLGFARALLLGDTSLIDDQTDVSLKISGIRHVIAVSGLHVSILFGLLYFLTGRRRGLVALVGLPVLVFFAAIVGFSPSITRACIMHGLMVTAMLFDREYDGPTALAFAVVVMLAFNPYTIINVSFQLSVCCMIGIFLFAEPIKAYLMDRKRLGKYKCRRLATWFSGSVGVSIGVTIIATPLCAYYFGTVSLVSILTNLLTLWVITYVFYGILAALVVGLIYHPIGAALAWAVSWGIRYVLAVADTLADFPLAAVYTSSIYVVLWLIFCYGLLAAYLCMKRKQPLVLGCCAALGLCLALTASWTEPLSDDCRMTVLDVGQGQCVLLQSDGKNFLVDCGGDSDASAADTAARLLLSQGIRRLDGMIVTHYDRDHAGGVAYLLNRVPADVLYLPESLDDAEISNGLVCYTGGKVELVDVCKAVTFLNTKITLIPSKNAQTDNESGLCVLYQRENCDILITGDRNADGEQELLQSIALPQLDVLVVGHHGSKYATSQALLEAAMPQIAIISVGENNTFGHPTQEVLDRLEAIGCIYYRTDQHGTVIYRG